MVIYFTFQETPGSAIYKTQVIDVVNYLSSAFQKDVRLLALVPAKGFFKYRKQIKQFSKVKTYVLPQIPLPRMYGWRLNAFILWLFCIVKRPSIIMCRSIFAGWLAIRIKKISSLDKIVFDSRGIITEEAAEYGVYPLHIIKQIKEVEKTCVLKCDFMMVITKQMVDYYKEKFGFVGENFVIIPCTMGDDFESISFNNQELVSIRNKLNYSDADVVVVYSGSNAKWQSFDLMLAYAQKILLAQKHIKLLLLTKRNELTDTISETFPGRVSCKWVQNSEVKDCLMACDYALMIREGSITNSFASPTKFAEYLASGLPVLANDTMAISNTIEERNAGMLIKDTHVDSFPSVNRVSLEEKNKMHQIAIELFSKKAMANMNSYYKVLGE